MKISIVAITYNQAAYIAQALDGVFAQDADFELIVGDDASTDDTPRILMEYAARHPDRMRVVKRERNIGAKANFLHTLSLASGEYVAFLEGDDYWTSPDKLRRQADFLDRNPTYSLCAHNHTSRNEASGEERVVYRSPEDRTLTIDRLIQNNMFHTSSLMWRRDLVGTWPACFAEIDFCDWPLQIILAKQGSVCLLADPMSVYRMHSGGGWTSRYCVPSDKAIMDVNVDGWERIIEFWEILRGHLGPDYDEQLRMLIDRKREQLQGLEAGGA